MIETYISLLGDQENFLETFDFYYISNKENKIYNYIVNNVFSENSKKMKIAKLDQEINEEDIENIKHIVFKSISSINRLFLYRYKRNIHSIEEHMQVTSEVIKSTRNICLTEGSLMYNNDDKYYINCNSWLSENINTDYFLMTIYDREASRKLEEYLNCNNDETKVYVLSIVIKKRTKDENSQEQDKDNYNVRTFFSSENNDIIRLIVIYNNKSNKLDINNMIWSNYS
ncbi:hypothetical protein AB837_00102 [bacterium AB1]|nr:hypothetical protein AB837_00102 [bacterium AB1]